MVPSHDGDGDKLFCFQLLMQRHAPILVHTFDGRLHDASKQWTIQPLEIWGALEVNQDTVEFNAFKLEDAKKVSPIDIFGNDSKMRHEFKVWTQVPSKLDGTIALASPVVISSKLSLSDSQIPVLCILESDLSLTGPIMISL